MRRLALILGALVGAVAVVVWALGGVQTLETWAVTAQRGVQDGLARAIRALRAGESGALATLLALCFGYGFFHAVGPGHGKFLIGGYGLARRVRLVPLAAIAVASSLAQATTAVVVVGAGVWLFGWSRARLEGIAEGALTQISHAAIAGLGLWLVWRGGRVLWRSHGAAAGTAHATATVHAASHAQGHGYGHAHAHAHDHGHAHDRAHHHHHHHAHAARSGGRTAQGGGDPAVCDTCGHSHGPSLEQIAQVTGWRAAAALVAGVALRPCTGALFLLILTWRMGIFEVGIAGAYAMGLGTATVTLAVAALAVWAREGAFAAVPGALRLRATLPLIEVAVGGTIAALSIALLLRSL